MKSRPFRVSLSVKLRDESVLVGMKSMAVGVAVRGDAMDPVTIELSVDDILAPPFIVTPEESELIARALRTAIAKEFDSI